MTRARLLSTLALLGTGCGRELYDPSQDAGPSRDAPPVDVGSASSPDAAIPALGAHFDEVVEQAPVNSTGREFGVSMSPDGLRLVLASYATGPGEPMGANLYLGLRASPADLFSGRTLLLEASSDLTEAEPTWAGGGSVLYYDRGNEMGLQRCAVMGDRCTGSEAVPGLEGFGGADVALGDTHLVVSRGGDLYESVRASTAEPWPAPRLLPLGGAEMDGFPSLREDGLEIFWERNTATRPAIWRATRPSLDAPFGDPELVSFAGLSGPTGDPDISADGRTLAFVASPESGATGEFDVFLARRSR